MGIDPEQVQVEFKHLAADIVDEDGFFTECIGNENPRNAARRFFHEQYRPFFEFPFTVQFGDELNGED